MKSKTSFFNKTIFVKNITHFWPIWIMILLWNLFIMPFMIYNQSLAYRFTDGWSAKDLAQRRIDDILGIVDVYMNPAILFIFSVVAVMAVFSYLYNARSANAIHALPVTRGELFLTNYISGLLFLLVPEIVAFLLGTLVSVFCGYTAINYLLLGLLYAAGISFIFYSFSVCIAMFTGQLFAVPIFSLILNFLYVGCKGILIVIMSAISYGISPSFTSGKLDVLSPLYCLSKDVGRSYVYEEGVSATKGLVGGDLVIAYAVAAAVVLIIAYLIYQKRNMETAGSLISVSWISPIFRWGVAFCGGGLFSVIGCMFLNVVSGSSLFFSLFAFAILFGGCFFFVAQMFLEKGFRVFRKKRWIECGVFLGIFACLLIALECDLFGQEKKMPDEADIDKAYINAHSIMEGSDPELIEEILEIHSQIINSKKEFEAYEVDNRTYYVGVKYFLKDGSVLKRDYNVPMSNEVLEDPSSVLYQIADLNAKPDVLEKSIFSIASENVEPQGGTIDLYNENGEWYQHEFSKEDIQKVYQAVLADIEEGNFKDFIFQRYNEEEGEWYDSATININYTGKEDIISAYTRYSGGSGYHTEDVDYGYASVEFDKNCKHIIEALIETGAVKQEEELFLSGKDDF